MKIEFIEKNHCYFVDGNIAEISVTELLKKHNLSSDYSRVPNDLLEISQAKGKQIHKDIEDIINNKEHEPITEQGKQFLKWKESNVDICKAEQKLAFIDEHTGFTLCGTADIMGITKGGELFIEDTKTTSVFNKESVEWQVSILDYMARRLSGTIVNGEKFEWNGAKKFLCLWFNKQSGELEEKKLNKIPDTKIVELLDKEIAGEIYQRTELSIDDEFIQEIEKAEQDLAEQDRQYKLLKARVDNNRERLCKLFELQGIKSWVSPNGLLKITYVEQAESCVIDSAKVKKDFPQVFMQCQKLKKTKAYLRVTNKLEVEKDD